MRERLSEEAFNANLAYTGSLSQNTLSVARAVLVNGRAQVEVADELGWSRQRVKGALDRYIAATNRVPRDWQRVTVLLPPSDARDVRALARRRFEALE